MNISACFSDSKRTMEQVEAPEDEPLDNEPVYSVNLEPQLTPLSELRAPTAVPEERVLVAAGYTYGVDGRGVRDHTMWDPTGFYATGGSGPYTEDQQRLRREGVTEALEGGHIALQRPHGEVDGSWPIGWAMMEGGRDVRDGPDDPFWMRTSAVAAGQLPYTRPSRFSPDWGGMRPGIDLNRHQMQHISTRDTGYVDRLHPITSTRPEDERMRLYHGPFPIEEEQLDPQHTFQAYSESSNFPYPMDV